MSDDIHAEARERYEQATEALIRRGLMTRAELKSERLGQDPRPIYFSPFRNSLVIREGLAAEKRAAEARDHREWIDGIRQRLGLVAEVHRCRVQSKRWRVEGYRWRQGWEWFCQRPGCDTFGVYLPSHAVAFAEALAHARLLVPKPPEEEPLTELQWALYMALAADAARQREADEAALSARIAAVTEQVNDAFTGLLPPGMRFEWAADGG